MRDGTKRRSVRTLGIPMSSNRKFQKFNLNGTEANSFEYTTSYAIVFPGNDKSVLSVSDVCVHVYNLNCEYEYLKHHQCCCCMLFFGSKTITQHRRDLFSH